MLDGEALTTRPELSLTLSALAVWGGVGARQRVSPRTLLDGKTVVGISGMNQVSGIELSMARCPSLNEPQMNCKWGGCCSQGEILGFRARKKVSEYRANMGMRTIL